MGILGKEDVLAGDTALWDRADERPIASAATPMIERLLDVGIDGRGPFRSAQNVADFALAERREVEPAVDALVRSHIRLAAANGFVTGLGGFAAIPIALPANVLGFYLVATRMVAGIAASRGHDISKHEVRTAVLLALVSADADDLVGRAGNAGSGQLFNLAAQRLPGPVLMAARKGILFRLLARIGKRSFARVGKAVPVAGGLVGAGLDSYLLKRIADHARLEFPLRPNRFPQLPTSPPERSNHDRRRQVSALEGAALTREGVSQRNPPGHPGCGSPPVGASATGLGHLQR